MFVDFLHFLTMTVNFQRVSGRACDSDWYIICTIEMDAR